MESSADLRIAMPTYLSNALRMNIFFISEIIQPAENKSDILLNDS